MFVSSTLQKFLIKEFYYTTTTTFGIEFYVPPSRVSATCLINAMHAFCATGLMYIVSVVFV